MKKAYLKKELKDFYIEGVSKSSIILFESGIEEVEDYKYLINTILSIASSKSANGKIYDILAERFPEKFKDISKKDFTEMIKTQIDEARKYIVLPE